MLRSSLVKLACVQSVMALKNLHTILVCSLLGTTAAARFVVVRGEEVNAFSVQQEN